MILVLVAASLASDVPPAESCIHLQQRTPARVEEILKSAGADQLTLNEAFAEEWAEVCGHSRDRPTSRAVRAMSRLLEVPVLRFRVARLLYGLGADARPALPMVRAAYLSQRSENASRLKRALVVSGPDVPTERSLKCLLVYLSRGQHSHNLCRSLDAYRRDEK